MFVLLCFVFCALLVILSLLLVIMASTMDYSFLAARLSFTFTLYLFIANKLCCCCCCVLKPKRFVCKTCAMSYVSCCCLLKFEIRLFRTETIIRNRNNDINPSLADGSGRLQRLYGPDSCEGTVDGPTSSMTSLMTSRHDVITSDVTSSCALVRARGCSLQ